MLKLNVVDQCLVAKGVEAQSWLWHSRFGHLNFHNLKELGSKQLLEGLLPLQVPSHLCRHCVVGKQSQTSFSSASEFRAAQPLKLIHVDICGPMDPLTLGGSHFFLLIIDDYSRLMWVALLKHKSDALSAFKKFKALAEVEKDLKIKCLQTDRGGEFTSNEFIDFCVTQGIKRHLTAPYSPQQNGIVERKNRTLMGMVRSMLKEKDLPKELWGEAVSTSIYLLNCSPTKSLQGVTPYEKWTERRPSVDHLRVFGSLAHVRITRGNQKKLEDRSHPMIFIGYEVGTKDIVSLTLSTLRSTSARTSSLKKTANGIG